MGTRVSAALNLALVFGLLTLLVGCNNSQPGVGDADKGGGGTTASCSTPNTGCSCSEPGQVVDCGKVEQTSGSYVTCSEGSRTCNGGTWGDCIGTHTSTKSLANLSTKGLGPSAACDDDPCDPYCNAFTNDPTGITLGPDAGVTIDDGGIELIGTPVPVTDCTGMQITPSTAPDKDLLITSMAPSPNSVSYTAALLPAACFAGVPSFLWSIDQYDIAQISSTGQLTVAVPIAGPINVSAYAGTLSASVVCNVTVNVVDTSAAPSGITNANFPTTTGAVDNIQALYPYPGTVFPLGLPSPLIQWQNNNSPATVADAVKITLRFPATGTPIFSWSEIENELQTNPTPSLPGKPRATIPQDVWQDFEETVVRNSGATGGDAVYAIQRTTGGVLGQELATTIHFANGQLKGSIFYNSYGTNLVQNFGYTTNGQAFGAATLQVAANGTSPTVVVGYNDPSLSGAGCRVCHNAASGGTRLLTNSYLSEGNSGGGSEATSFSYDPTLGSPAAIQGSQSLIGTSYGTNNFTYAALSPDGSYLMTSAAPASSNPSAALYTIGGSPITSNLPGNLHAATPAFAADASEVAFNFYQGDANPLSTATADGKSLAMMDFSPPSTFSNFRVLETPGALYSVWPTFLPPGQNGIVFQNELQDNGRDWAGTRSRCDGSGSCNDIGATGELWWVDTSASPQAVPLTNLNGGSYMPRLPGGANYHGTSADNGTYYEEVYNYEPAALPVTIGGYSWVAFTSRRLYGNVATNDPYWSDPRYQDLSQQPTTKKIWIAAISNNPTPGTDPSFPAFYLPGQELLAGNSRAYFTLAACEAPGPPTPANLCTSNLDCCGGTSSPATAACQLDPPPLSNPPTSHCVSTTASTCVADGASCTSDAQCCNFGAGSICGSGKCGQAPPILTYAAATYTTTYQSACPDQTYPVWRFFYWKAATPTGTSINFTAETSSDGHTWGAAVPVGTVSPPPLVTTVWTSGPMTVDDALKAAGQTSLSQLLVTAQLNPSADGTSTPALTDWQVTYDCLPSE